MSGLTTVRHAEAAEQVPHADPKATSSAPGKARNCSVCSAQLPCDLKSGSSGDRESRAKGG